jgi:hypothetical protein
MALADVIDQYVTAFGAMTGIIKCHADPPEQMAQFPCAIVYVSSGEITSMAGRAQAIHVITLDIHHSRVILPRAVDEAKVWPERVTNKLWTGGTFGGYVAAVVWPVTYEALALSYAGEVHYGLRFRIPTKVITDPTT